MTQAFDSGAILAGKYRVERVLGQGGMGVVLAGWHLQLEERVAIKLMLPGAAMSEDAVARFLREARAAAKIQSEHIARVWDVGTLENGQPYMVMQYLEGSDLSGVLASRGALPVDEAADYLLQACEAIAEAHSLGIVHRDLKPGNLFLATRRDGSVNVKVLDFGISKVTGSAKSDSDGAKTRTSALMGSPLYMSPEQMTSPRDVDARSDVWALGVILFELVTGKPPFDAETLPQVCSLILSAPAPSLRERRPDVPHDLEAVISRCLEKSADRRYASVAEFARALSAFATRRSHLSVERISRVLSPNDAPVAEARALPEPAGVQAGTNFEFGKTTTGKSSKPRTFWVLAGIGVVSLIAAAAFFKLRPSDAVRLEGATSAAPAATTVAAIEPTSAPPTGVETPIAPARAATASAPPTSATPSVAGAPHSEAKPARASRAAAPANVAQAVPATSKPTSITSSSSKKPSLGGRL